MIIEWLTNYYCKFMSNLNRTMVMKLSNLGMGGVNGSYLKQNYCDIANHVHM